MKNTTEYSKAHGHRSMRVTAATRVAASAERLWALACSPAQHVRWDLRFTTIEPLSEPRRSTETLFFRYETRLAKWLRVEGWGEAIEKPMRSTALRFGSASPLSPIVEGTGSWLLRRGDHDVELTSSYDYKVRWGWLGKLFDPILFRPLMQWATRWSFDRLRLWIDARIPPEIGLRLWLVKLVARVALALVWLHEGLVPKILAVTPEEIALVDRSGIWIGSAEATLNALGVAEIILGLWLLVGWRERLSVTLATLASLSLAGLVVLDDPSALTSPVGGISKNLGLFASALTVWALAPITPDASRADPSKLREEATS